MQHPQTQFDQSVFFMECGFQNYQWGKVGDKSAVYKIISNTQTKSFDKNKPYAELWMGTHSNLPSYVLYKEQKYKLKDLLEQNPQKFLGNYVLEKFNQQQLPFLFKVLSVDKALSIQAHPDKSLAEKLFKSDPEHYKDDNYKPEMAYALTDYEALCRFCQKDKLIQNIELVPELHKLLDQSVYNQLKSETEYNKQKELFKQLFSEFLKVPENYIVAQLQQVVNRLQNKQELNIRENLILKLYKQYPDDIGVFVSLFLNYIILKPGECIVMDANEPHAYISGNCLESMANSDNVVRLGLTPKFKDTDTLKDMLTYELQDPQIFTGKVLQRLNDYKICELNSGYQEFKCYNIDIFNINTNTINIKSQSPLILLVTKGQAVLINEFEQYQINYGHTLYICPNTWFRIKNISEQQFQCNICGVNEQKLQFKE